MNKETYEKIINYAMNKGVDFVELYYDEQNSKQYILVDSKLDDEFWTEYFKDYSINIDVRKLASEVIKKLKHIKLISPII